VSSNKGGKAKGKNGWGENIFRGGSLKNKQGGKKKESKGEGEIKKKFGRGVFAPGWGAKGGSAGKKRNQTA